MTEQDLISKIKYWVTVFDLPSGVVLGIHTAVMISLSIAAFVLNRGIDATITTVYGIVLGAFAIHKTTTATTQIVTQSSQGQDTDVKPN